MVAVSILLWHAALAQHSGQPSGQSPVVPQRRHYIISWMVLWHGNCILAGRMSAEWPHSFVMTHMWKWRLRNMRCMSWHAPC